ncbi:MAG TPA: ATP-binding protein [Candidatus Dormibacteraeota bacterium]|nr:ATP-binding protein [Candidatus Dormibacteraeota bacterium]
MLEEKASSYFTDFNGRFKARLAAVTPAFMPAATHELTGISSRYECRIKVEYHKDIMGLIEEGMLVAVRNFKSNPKDQRHSLMVISRVWPEHYGLKGLSEHSYYPMQFEIIQQSVKDWDTSDKSTMMVQISALPINYDLVLNGDSEPKYEKGFTYPVIAAEAEILNRDMISHMYNQRVLAKLGFNTKTTTSDAYKDPRIGTIQMFESMEEKIPIYLDFEAMVRYHFGIFAFTGAGKSNLLSNILRRLLIHQPEVKVIVFDISSEYPFLLMDLFADDKIPSKIILENPVTNAEQFYASVVKPREYEDDDRARKVFARIFGQKKITYYLKPESKVPTYGDIVEELNRQRNESLDKPHYVNALDRIRQDVVDYKAEHGMTDSKPIDEEFIKQLDEWGRAAVDEYKISDRSGVYAWATSRLTLIDNLKRAEKEKRTTGGLDIEGIRELVEKETRLTCISISDPYVIKELVVDLAREFLYRRKRAFKVKPYVLFVFDEAQEFVPDLGGSSGIDKDCSKVVETLLRQGRKYGLGGCLATQRIAYLNTNALQQLHTYFVGTLPRPYDRTVVSDTFTIDKQILEKTLEFAPGEWLLSSFIATGMENVPIFIRADNAEAEVEKTLNKLA